MKKIITVLLLLVSVQVGASLITTSVNGYFQQDGYLVGNSRWDGGTVETGDEFSLIFNYDDTVFTTAPYYANGRTYTRNTYQTSLEGGSGILYSYLASLYPNFTRTSTARSPNSPIENVEWRFDSGVMITDSDSSAAGYGWSDYGNPSQGTFLLSSVIYTTNPDPSPEPDPVAVPEPTTITLLGLGLFGLVMRRKLV